MLEWGEGMRVMRDTETIVKAYGLVYRFEGDRFLNSVDVG